MKREIVTFKDYFSDFLKMLNSKERKKLDYLLGLLETEERVSTEIVKHIEDGIFELIMLYSSNIYRVFFIFDEGNIVILFNGFQKKTQKIPKNEIDKAKRIKNEYYEDKQQH